MTTNRATVRTAILATAFVAAPVRATAAPPGPAVGSAEAGPGPGAPAGGSGPTAPEEGKATAPAGDDPGAGGADRAPEATPAPAPAAGTAAKPAPSSPSESSGERAAPLAEPPRTIVPLPPPPPRAPAAAIPKGPWYGTFWFEIRPDLTVPLGGRQPARGSVVSGGGTVGFGYRPHRLVGLRTALGLTLHDARARRVETVFGDRIHVVDYGQILAFEFLGLRAFAPVHRRFLPYADAAGGMVIWFPADGRPAVPGALLRAAAGFEGWVAPRVTLGVEVAYRMLALSSTFGHALQPSALLGIHW